MINLVKKIYMYKNSLFIIVVFAFLICLGCSKDKGDVINPEITLRKPVDNFNVRPGDFINVDASLYDYNELDIINLSISAYSEIDIDLWSWDSIINLSGLQRKEINLYLAIPLNAKIGDYLLEIDLKDKSQNSTLNRIPFSIMDSI